jgi:hypothetical protein
MPAYRRARRKLKNLLKHLYSFGGDLSPTHSPNVMRLKMKMKGNHQTFYFIPAFNAIWAKPLTGRF